MKKENEVNAAEKVRALHSLHTGVEGIECTFGTSKRVEISRSPFWNIGSYLLIRNFIGKHTFTENDFFFNFHKQDLGLNVSKCNALLNCLYSFLSPFLCFRIIGI